MEAIGLCTFFVLEQQRFLPDIQGKEKAIKRKFGEVLVRPKSGSQSKIKPVQANLSHSP